MADEQQRLPVPPRRFTELLVTFQRTRDERVRQILVRTCFFPLVAGLLRKYRFRFVDPQEALQVAVIACLEKVDRFDLNRATRYAQSSGDPMRKGFSFFTMVAMNTYRGLYRQEIGLANGKANAIKRAMEDFYTDNPTVKSKRYQDTYDVPQEAFET